MNDEIVVPSPHFFILLTFCIGILNQNLRIPFDFMIFTSKTEEDMRREFFSGSGTAAYLFKDGGISQEYNTYILIE